jgi:hypothetical protein
VKTRTEGGEQHGRDRYASTAPAIFQLPDQTVHARARRRSLDELPKRSRKDTAQCNLEQLYIDYCNTVFDRLWGGPTKLTELTLFPFSRVREINGTLVLSSLENLPGARFNTQGPLSYSEITGTNPERSDFFSSQNNVYNTR